MFTKKLLSVALVTLTLAIASPVHAAFAVSEEAPKTEEVRVSELRDRIFEISAMDKSELSKTERKNLKNELKDAKNELKKISGGIYISALGLIILIVILILVL